MASGYKACLIACLLRLSLWIWTAWMLTRFLPRPPRFSWTTQYLAELRGVLAPAQFLGLVITLAFSCLLAAPLTAGLAFAYLSLATHMPLTLRRCLTFLAGRGAWTGALQLLALRRIVAAIWYLPAGALTYALCCVPCSPMQRLGLALLALALYFLAWVCAGRYAAAPYILAFNGAIGPRSALQQSAQYMRGRLWFFAALRLSFLPWLLVTLLTCGLGHFFAAPYYQMSKTLFVARACSPFYLNRKRRKA